MFLDDDDDDGLLSLSYSETMHEQYIGTQASERGKGHCYAVRSDTKIDQQSALDV